MTEVFPETVQETECNVPMKVLYISLLLCVHSHNEPMGKVVGRDVHYIYCLCLGRSVKHSMMLMAPSLTSSRPSKDAVMYSNARVFVGQLEPYVTEEDLFPVFSCYGKILYLNVVRHSTTVTPNEERRIPTAFVWYETTAEADAAIAALHNVFSFSSSDEEESKRRYIQVSYADKSPQCTSWGKWQKRHAEIQRHAVNQNSKKGGWSVKPSMDEFVPCAPVIHGEIYSHVEHANWGAMQL